MVENKKYYSFDINQQNFLDWVEKRIGGDYIVKGDEVMLNSIFTKSSDQAHKLYCNVKKNVYHCWKTGKKGQIINLIREIEGCSFKEAIEILGGETESSWEDLCQKAEKFFSTYQENPIQDYQENPIQENTKEIKLKLPEHSYPILDLPEWNPFRKKAEKYLNKRKIEIQGFYVCTAGNYRGRIVLPYYNKEGKLIYYNCRALNNEIPKYLGPPKEKVKIGKSNVIFIPKYPPKNEKIYITEGEFDALSILQSGLYAGALGGKNLSNYHLNILKDYIPVLAFDNDDGKLENYGELATMIIGETLLKNGFKVFYVRPPNNVKDWNELLEKYNKEIVKGYIEKNEKPFTENTIVELMEKQII